MLSLAGMGMQHEPIRLCGACYGENPCDRMQNLWTKVARSSRETRCIVANGTKVSKNWEQDYLVGLTQTGRTDKGQYARHTSV